MSVTHPAGFIAAGVPAGLKSISGKPAPWFANFYKEGTQALLDRTLPDAGLDRPR